MPSCVELDYLRSAAVGGAKEATELLCQEVFTSHLSRVCSYKKTKHNNNNTNNVQNTALWTRYRESVSDAAMAGKWNWFYLLGLFTQLR